MSWSNKATLAGLNVALSEITNADADYVAADHYSQWDTLNPGETAQLQVEVAFGTTGSDVYFRAVGTLDATTENADNVAFIAGVVPFIASTTVRRSINLSNLYKYRIEFRKGGTSAGSYTPNVYVRKNGVSI